MNHLRDETARQQRAARRRRIPRSSAMTALGHSWRAGLSTQGAYRFAQRPIRLDPSHRAHGDECISRWAMPARTAAIRDRGWFTRCVAIRDVET